MKLANFEKMSAFDGTQVVLQFGDEYELSVVSHSGSYGGRDGLYEIATYKHGSQTEMPGITAVGDTVKGYLTETDVDAIIVKMISVTGKEPTQI
jgi:hypothetical protein